MPLKLLLIGNDRGSKVTDLVLQETRENAFSLKLIDHFLSLWHQVKSLY